MRLLVVGGSGFVGTRVVRTALAQGVHVASISRSGKPIAGAADLTGVEWLKGDVVAGGEALHSALSDCDAVISCLGAFGSNEFMHQVNGTANAALAEASAKAGVDRFAFISASAIRPVAKAMAAAGYEGYYAGKLTAEEAVKRHFGSAGLILRPGPIYGTRAVSPNISVPIGAIGIPLTTIFETAPVRSLASALPMEMGDLIMPWVSVDDVAAAAVAHAIGKTTSGGGEGGGGGGEGGGSEDSGRSGAASMLEWDGIRKAASQLRMSLPAEVSLFWDGACPLCQIEIAHYSSIDVERRVDWVDLTRHPERLSAASASASPYTNP